MDVQKAASLSDEGRGFGDVSDGQTRLTTWALAAGGGRRRFPVALVLGATRTPRALQTDGHKRM
jgi:hypothetical protein